MTIRKRFSLPGWMAWVASGIYFLVFAGSVIIGGQLPSPFSLEWNLAASFPEPRSGYSGGVLDGKVVIAGGTYWDGTKDHWIKKRYSASTHAFDPASGRWEKLPDLPVPLGYAAAAVVDNKLFVMGGYSDARVNRKVFELRKIGDHYAWSVFSTIGLDRIFASAVSIGKTIYVVGGKTSFEAFDAMGTCCMSNTATNTLMALDIDHPATGWQQLSSYPGKPRWLPTVTSDAQSIWLLGGLFQNAQKSPVIRFDEVLKYDIAQGKWMVMPPLPKEAAESQPLSSLTIANQILLFSSHKKVWGLDLGTGRYSETTPKLQSAAVDQFFWLDQEIIGAGGENQPEGPRRRSPWTFTARIVPVGTK